MSRKRLLGCAVLVTVSPQDRCSRCRRARRRRSRRHRSSSGSSRSSRSTSTSPSSNAAKKWDAATPGAKVIFAQGKSGNGRRGRDRRDPEHGRPGREGDRDHADERGGVRRARQGDQAGRQGRPDGQRHPDVEEQDVRRRDEQPKGGVLAGKFLATKLKAGDTLGILEGVPGVPALDARVAGMLAGLGALSQSDQGRLEARDGLRPDQGRGRRPDDADREQEPDRDLRRVWAARARRDPVDQERRASSPTRSSSSGSTRLPDEVAQIKAGNETGSVAQFPAKIGSLGVATLYNAVKGKKVPKNVDTGHRVRHQGERRPVRLEGTGSPS